MRYLLIIIAILSMALGWYVFKDNRSQDKITALTTENSALIGQLKSKEKENDLQVWTIRWVGK